jgi:hypothetical protein
MIVFDLACADGHRFEGWFASGEEFAAQCGRGLVECPQCGSADVAKAPMAPAVPRKGNRRAEAADLKQAVAGGAMPPEVAAALGQLAQAQAKALESSTWVGDKFAERSRAMHYGEQDAETIHGRASLREATALREEGIAVAPLPFPVAGPKDLN